MKKLFALLTVVAFAAVGCDDKKTSPPKGSGTVTNTKTVVVEPTVTATKTVVNATVTDTKTKVVEKTVTIDAPKKPEGPVPPVDPKKEDPKKGDGK